jgi:hypothetical protein
MRKTLMPDNYNGTGAPFHMRGALEEYVLNGRPTGGFLRAVITDSLQDAVGRADKSNAKILSTYILWLVNHTPAACWGSPEAYDNWVHCKGLNGLRTSQKAPSGV